MAFAEVEIEDAVVSAIEASATVDLKGLVLGNARMNPARGVRCALIPALAATDMGFGRGDARLMRRTATLTFTLTGTDVSADSVLADIRTWVLANWRTHFDEITGYRVLRGIKEANSVVDVAEFGVVFVEEN